MDAVPVQLARRHCVVVNAKSKFGFFNDQSGKGLCQWRQMQRHRPIYTLDNGRYGLHRYTCILSICVIKQFGYHQLTVPLDRCTSA